MRYGSMQQRLIAQQEARIQQVRRSNDRLRVERDALIQEVARLRAVIEQHSVTEYQEENVKTICEECGDLLTLNTVDADGVLIGDECQCGYYVTRYMPGQEPKE